MRKLTKKEIDDAPNWAVSYCFEGKILSYHERHYGFTQPIPREQFDISIGFAKVELLNLISKIEDIDDCGPAHEGWQSDELMGLISKLKKAAEGLK
jgi:hypothetical protein